MNTPAALSNAALVLSRVSVAGTERPGVRRTVAVVLGDQPGQDSQVASSKAVVSDQCCVSTDTAVSPRGLGEEGVAPCGLWMLCVAGAGRYAVGVSASDGTELTPLATMRAGSPEQAPEFADIEVVLPGVTVLGSRTADDVTVLAGTGGIRATEQELRRFVAAEQARIMQQRPDSRDLGR